MPTPTQPRTSAGPLSYRYPGPAAISVAVVLGKDMPELPAALRHLRPAVTRDLAAVRPTSRVVALCGAGMASACRTLSSSLGDAMPPVMMVAPLVDPADIIAAFRNGATSYMLDGTDPSAGAACLPCAVSGTADGRTHLHPAVAAVLVARLSMRTPAYRNAGHQGRVDAGPGGVLSGRERDVMEALVEGHSPGEIAVRLSLAEKTVRNYLSNIYKKLQVHSQAQAVLCWLDRPPHG